MPEETIMSAAEEKQMVHMRLEGPLLKRLDDFRFKHRFASRTDALRWLVEWALAQKPVVDELLHRFPLLCRAPPRSPPQFDP